MSAPGGLLTVTTAAIVRSPLATAASLAGYATTILPVSISYRTDTTE